MGEIGGPDIVPANATVSRGQVLHIEPGVEVIFGPGVHMYIDGRIQAQGLSDDPIRFHAISVSNQWDSIRVPDRGPEARSIFRWCTFSDSTVGLWLYAIGGEIEHQEVSSCVFENCGTGIVGWSTGESDRAITPNSLDALIQNCRFVNCATNGLTFVLRRNGDGLPYDRRGMASPVVQNNTFLDIGDTAMAFDVEFGDTSQPKVINNTVFNAMTGLRTRASYDVILKNNLFVSCSWAVRRSTVDDLNLSVNYNGFYNNGTNFLNYPGQYG